jgi:hypothetical protein
MVRRSLRILLAATVALTGCNALLDVKDIYFDPNAGAPGTPDGSTDGATTSEGSTPEGGTDSASCAADLTKDKLNCGRCGHSCLGGECTAGKCQGLELGAIADVPLFHVVASDQHVFASTRITLSNQVGGIWREAKTGGTPELYANIRYAEAMAILGDKLYFVVDDNPANGTDAFGGLYSCPLTGTAPCTPTLIAASKDSRAITVDTNRVLYGDDGVGKGLMLYVPPAAPTVFRADYGFASNYYVEGNTAFYSVTIQNGPPQQAKVIEIFADGGNNEKYRYESDTADDGQLLGSPASLLFTAYDFSGTTGGVVRRIPRAGAAPCDLGGTTNKRPFGIHADANRVYWANQGDGPAEPYTNGSIVSCDQAGCCTTPDVMWTGDGQPSAVTGDANAVYFVTYATGAIWKIAKP